MSYHLGTNSKVAASNVGSVGAVSVTTTATLIRADTDSRVALMIVNNGASTLYVGQASTVTTSTGIPVAAGAMFSDSNYTGDLYGIVASGTLDVRYWTVN